MATTYNWSEQSNGANLVFDPTVDVLNFDSGISAANVFFDATEPSPGILHTVFTINGKTVTIQTDPFRLTTTNITFSNGSRLMIGDNSNDTQYGDDNGNTLNSTLGSTVAGAGSGDDLLVGAGGNDTMVGNGGNDVFVIVGDEFGIYGADSIIGGGGGSDRLFYMDDNGFGITVNMGTGFTTQQGGALTGGTANGGDGNPGSSIVFSGIEAVTGTHNGDTFTASDDAPINGLRTDIQQRFEGRGGNDTLVGADDELSATMGGRVTVAEYRMSESGVYVNLGAGTASDGMGGSDTLVDIDAVVGSQFDDTLVGSSLSRSIGGTFFEFFEGLGGNDTIDGSFGSDRATYDSSPSAVIVNLSDSMYGGVASGQASDGWGGTDSLFNIEQIRGSAHADTLVGNTWDETQIEGRAGNDYIVGGNELDNTRYSSSPFAAVVNLGSSDLIGNFYGAGEITVSGGTARDGWDSVGGGTDVLFSIEGVRGTDFNDTLVGGGPGAYAGEISGGVEQFEGWAGADSIVGGGGGIDVAAYNRDPHAVVVNLSSGSVFVTDGSLGAVTVAGGTALDGYWMNNLGANGSLKTATQAERTDTLVNINGAEGSNFNDTLIGGSGNEHFQGNGGNDYIDGGSGIDTVYFDGSYGAIVNLTGSSVVVNGVTVQGGTARDGMDSSGGGADTLLNIENIEGSEFDDFIIGNNLDNVIRGWEGNDVLTGSGASSTATGGNDLLMGDEGDDVLRVTKGSDTLDGGADFDRIAFNSPNGNSTTGITYTVPGGVIVDLEAGTADYDSTDGGNPLTTLIGIESAWGTSGNDLLQGGSLGRTANGTFMESFRGGAGADTMDGTSGGWDGTVGFLDRVEFESLTSTVNGGSVVVNLGTDTQFVGGDTIYGGTAKDGYGSVDRLIDINWVAGTGNNDTMFGSDNTGDRFERFEGRGGNDWIVGGAGIDEVSYQNAYGAVNVDLSIGNSSGQDGSDTAFGYDILFGIERVRGSNYGDSLVGGSGNEVFTGGGGNDTIDGGGGIDYASWQVADLIRNPDNSIGQGMVAFLENGSGVITYGAGSPDDHGTDFLTNIEGLIGTSNNDSLVGGMGDQWFIGRGGSDTLIGGSGFDWADYSTDPNTGIVVNLSNSQVSVYSTVEANSALDGWGGLFDLQGTDSLDGIEGIIATSGFDTVFGGTAAEYIDLGDGGDLMLGSAGADTLIGGGGWDVLNYDDSPNRVIVNLFAPGANSTIVVGNDTLVASTARDGYGATDSISGFEEVRGSDYNDYIQGQSGLANRFLGGAGNDTLIGGGNSDTVSGGLSDTVEGGSGDDRLIQAGGADYIFGDDGYDTLSFVSGVSSAHVDLSTGQSIANHSGGASTASIFGIEQVFGTTGDDLLVGGYSGHGADTIGNQVIESFRGGAGNDTLDGGDGDAFFTRADYGNDTMGVSVDLGTNSATGGDIGSDTLYDIDQVYGGSGADLLVGGSSSRSPFGSFFESFRGNAGNDTIDGGDDASGLGSLGNDRVSYENSTNAVVVNLSNNAVGTMYGTVAAERARDGFDTAGGGTDTLIDINMARGSAFGDTLVGGDNGFYSLEGMGGSDLLIGGNGWQDEARYDAATSGITADLGSGIVSDGMGGNDTLQGIEGIRGSDFADYITGSNASRDEFFIGGAGNDYINGGGTGGGDYIDWASYRSSVSGVHVALNSSVAFNDGFGGMDTLFGINGLDGSNFNDTLVGTSGQQDLMGRGGNDILDGGAGFDIANYSRDPNGVIVNLGTTSVVVGSETILGGTARDGWGGIYGMGGTDTLLNIEGTEGTNSADTLVGSAVANYLGGNGGSDSLHGGDAADTMEGGGGADTLDGGIGIDRMIGNAGDDWYIVDSTSDLVLEVSGEGLDRVMSLATFTLSANVENLTLTGSDSIFGYGNTSANFLTGNAQFNRLYGYGGADTLDGGAGADIMYGGADNDLYFVDNTSDSVFESASEGIDEIRATATYTLGVNVENLTLLGSGNINGTGNTTSNLILGNTGNNLLNGSGGNDTLLGAEGGDTLDGGANADSMLGGIGDDTYVIDDLGDQIFEATGEGIDTVRTAFSHTLGADFEHLILTGASNINGTGNAFNNIITGNSGLNHIIGDSGADTISGGGGADTLDGGVGIDRMSGNAGDDWYIVDNTSDLALELSSEGLDRVMSSVTYTLGANVENLILTGSDSIFGYGNTSANYLTGNSQFNRLYGYVGADTLDGGGGADIMYGGADNDLYFVDNVGDGAYESLGEGVDEVRSTSTYSISINIENLTLLGTGSINGSGNADNNYLKGNSGDNVLNGGAGVDTMAGGFGNDTYIVDNTGDVLTESGGGGVDLVQTSVTYSLGGGLENIQLTGSAVIFGYGNNIDNVLTGNVVGNRLYGYNGNDTLDGGGGADTVYGGAGDDLYLVDNSSDGSYESANEGLDEVRSTVTYSLSVNVENLRLLGSSAILGYGNASDNYMTGNGATNRLYGFDGADTLDGGAGNDIIYGGLGNDLYLVDSGSDINYEGIGEGVDTVHATVTYSLGANIENLVLMGSSSIFGYGNASDNQMIGNDGVNRFYGYGGHDTLDGGAGADIVYGGGGNDVYIVDNTGDASYEALNEGTDEVHSSATYTIGNHVENLTLTGGGDINGTGNGLANVLKGNAGNNLLSGLAGDDTLVWGAGLDTLAGGADTDTLLIDGSGVTLDLTVVADNRITNVEIINISGSGNNTLTLALSDVLAISSTTDTLRVDGDSGDVVNAGSGWSNLGLSGGYYTYTQGLATLLVDEDVTRNIT